jgi:hypothetical protein
MTSRQILGTQSRRVRTYTPEEMEEFLREEEARAAEIKAKAAVATAAPAPGAAPAAKAEAQTGKKVELEEILKSNPPLIPKIPVNSASSMKESRFDKIVPYLTGWTVGSIIGECLIRDKLGISEIPMISGSLLTTNYGGYLGGDKILGKYENKLKEARIK